LVIAAVVSATGRLPAQEPVTVFVVRHAEKGPDGQDPSLNEVGRARATALAHALGDVKISAIITSQFKRTTETGAPLAQRLGLTPRVIDAGDLNALAAAVLGLAPGSRALVVSHSNLVPGIVERLSGEKVGELTEADYDRLFVVTVRRGSNPGTVLYLHYGAPAPSRP
jgi:broad specificity phosphatase PhoE